MSSPVFILSGYLFEDTCSMLPFLILIHCMPVCSTILIFFSIILVYKIGLMIFRFFFAASLYGFFPIVTVQNDLKVAFIMIEFIEKNAYKRLPTNDQANHCFFI